MAGLEQQRAKDILTMLMIQCLQSPDDGTIRYDSTRPGRPV